MDNDTQVAFDLLSTLDDEGYPTDETLALVKEYSGSVLDFFAELKKVWYLASWGWHEENGFRAGFRRKDHKVRRFHISTAGWSGNESLVDAMKENYFLWHFSWVQERVGGHFIFEVREGDRVYSKAELDAARAKREGQQPLPAAPEEE